MPRPARTGWCSRPAWRPIRRSNFTRRVWIPATRAAGVLDAWHPEPTPSSTACSRSFSHRLRPGHDGPRRRSGKRAAERVTCASGWSGRRESNPHRELGKLPWTAPYGAILQLGGKTHRPLLSVSDRRRPMSQGTSGARPMRVNMLGLAAIAPTRREGEAQPRSRLPSWQGPLAHGSRKVGFEPAVSLHHSPRSWPGRCGDLRFLRTGRDRSCPPKTSSSRCRADPPRTEPRGDP